MLIAGIWANIKQIKLYKKLDNAKEDEEVSSELVWPKETGK